MAIILRPETFAFLDTKIGTKLTAMSTKIEQDSQHISLIATKQEQIDEDLADTIARVDVEAGKIALIAQFNGQGSLINVQPDFIDLISESGRINVKGSQITLDASTGYDDGFINLMANEIKISGSQIVLDGNTVVSEGFSLTADKIIGGKLIVGGTGGIGIIDVLGPSGKSEGGISAEGISFDNAMFVNLTVDGGELKVKNNIIVEGNNAIKMDGIDIVPYTISFSGNINHHWIIEAFGLGGIEVRGLVTFGDYGDSDVRFENGLILQNATAGKGIKHPNGDNIVRGNYDSDVYIGGGNASSIWLSATNIYYTDKAPSHSGSDRRIKHDIKPADDSFVDFTMSLIPCTYKFNDGTSNRTHWGFIADEVEKALKETTGDSGVFVKIPIDENTKVDLEDDSTYIGGLRYAEFIPPVVKTVQKHENDILELKPLKLELKQLKSEVESMKNEISELKQLISNMKNNP